MTAPLIDFLDSTPCVCPLSPCVLHAEAVTSAAADNEGARAVLFTGIVCNHPKCTAGIHGKTDTREQLHALTLRAEAAGWQCRFVDGEAMHWCPLHASPDRERLRRLYK